MVQPKETQSKKPTYANPYFYNKQLVNYILQFMAVFAQMQVSVGKRGPDEPIPPDCPPVEYTEEDKKETLISVPIHWGAQDRIVRSILADNTQNKLMRLPIMSAYLKGLELANDIRHGTGNVRRNTYVPTGGMIPDDIQVVYQAVPNYCYADFELAIYASNVNQMYQILEQIIPMFDPRIQIQTNDTQFDPTRMTTIELTGMALEQNYPSGTDPRIIQSTLTFRAPIYISVPASIRRNFIEKVYARVGVVSDLNASNYDIIAELDRLGIKYDLIADASVLDFK